MDALKDLYEALPYPERKPDDERHRLIAGSPSRPEEIDHFVFAGRRDWQAPFTALVAGGGTGDGLIMLAHKLRERGTPADITYLDISGPSREIAEARAKIRGLTNIRFETGSLLSAPDFGPFDYVDCCGVIHHLSDPAEGLAALATSLKPGGGIGLMVYAPLGRTGVYELQATLRALAPPTLPLPERIAAAKTLLAALPASNRFARNPYLGDHRTSDAGLADLLLNPSDRAYTVDELAVLARAAGLRIAGFIEPLLYDPLPFLPEGSLRARAAALPFHARASLAEALHGTLAKHVAYLVAEDHPLSPPEPSPGAVPVWTEDLRAALANAIAARGQFRGQLGGLKVAIAMPPDAPRIVRAMDGDANFAAIAAQLPGDRPPGERDKAVRDVYAALHGAGLVYLRSG